jgi:23S rRNA (uracil1939-C5)-methyltransferase
MNPAEIRLHLEKMVHNGAALGRYKGKAVFVPYAVPGETILAQIEKSTRSWSRARLIRIERPSPHRKRPVCPHFGMDGCGGCQWQHIRYQAQLEYKNQIITEQLMRLAKLPSPPVNPILPGGPGLGYRNRIRLHASPEGWGYVNADKRFVLPIEVCPLMHPLLKKPFLSLRPPSPEDLSLSLRAGTRTGDAIKILEDKRGETTVSGSNGYIREKAGSFTYKISAGSFFQVNSSGAETLLNLVMAYACPRPNDPWLDLYSGTGLFSLSLAKQTEHVTAVESHPQAVADARFNAEAAGLENKITWIQDKAGSAKLKGRYFGAVLDPPRSGAASSVLRQIDRLQVCRLIYVSCDPATLARDTAVLVKNGFSPVRIQPVDLFPQTFHIETVCLFER